MRFRGFIGPTYALRSPNADCQRCVNLIPQINELQTGKEGELGCLVRTPGLKRLLTLPEGPIRGLCVGYDGVLYVAAGRSLYAITPRSLDVRPVGQLSTSLGVVSMAINTSQVCLVDGPFGYVWTPSTQTFQRIDSDAFYGAHRVTFIDDYFVFDRPGTGQFYLSQLGDGLSFDGLDFGSLETAPDKVVSHVNYQGQLWVLGEIITEVFYDTGDVNFPFSRVQGVVIEHGCAAAASVCKVGMEMLWLGKDAQGSGVVWRAQGFNVTRASNHAVEGVIQRYAKTEDATAYAYQQDGHQCYILNFPSANSTWCFDLTTGQWHERAATLPDGTLGRHRGDGVAAWTGLLVTGDNEDGRLYTLDQSTYDDDGVPITLLRRAPHLSSGLDRIFYPSFQLDVTPGVGLDGAHYAPLEVPARYRTLQPQGADPQVLLSFSDDGGHSWSTDRAESLGPIGELRRRVIWRRLGQARDRVFQIKITDPVNITILGAEVQVTKGNA